jgi:AcrR family transcriptional regulator
MDETSDSGLPASIEAAWGLRERPTKGPKPGLSVARIVQAAVRVAAAEGLAAVSMKRIATELGASAMSLYRYVSAKDELLALMVDAAIGVPPAPAPGEDWRAGLARWAWGYHDALRRHTWALRVPISGPPVTPNQTAWLEDGLTSLRDTGLREDEKLSVILLLSGYVRSEATLTADIGAALAASAAPEREIMPGWAELLRRLTSADGHPALHRVLASGALDRDDDPDDEFAFGLERVLDGVDVLVHERAAG